MLYMRLPMMSARFGTTATPPWIMPMLHRRISDQGGGIPTNDVSKVWHYGYTTMDHGTDFHGLRDSDPSWALPPESGAQYRMGGLGFGLPMSRLYAEYFGEPLHCFNLGCVINNDKNQNAC